MPAIDVFVDELDLRGLKDKIASLREQMRKYKALEVAVHAAPDKQISLTDPDARSMATTGKDMGLVGYNVQAVVDAQHHLIVAHEVTNIGNDRGQISMMAKQAQEATGVCELRRYPIASSHVVTLWCTSISLEHNWAGPAFKPDIVRLIRLRAWWPRRKDQGDNINLRRGSTPRCVHIKTTSRRTSQTYARDHLSRCR